MNKIRHTVFPQTAVQKHCGYRFISDIDAEDFSAHQVYVSRVMLLKIWNCFYHESTKNRKHEIDYFYVFKISCFRG
jgi:hypothetical protein